MQVKNENLHIIKAMLFVGNSIIVLIKYFFKLLSKSHSSKTDENLQNLYTQKMWLKKWDFKHVKLILIYYWIKNFNVILSKEIICKSYQFYGAKPITFRLLVRSLLPCKIDVEKRLLIALLSRRKDLDALLKRFNFLMLLHLSQTIRDSFQPDKLDLKFLRIVFYLV